MAKTASTRADGLAARIYGGRPIDCLCPAQRPTSIEDVEHSTAREGRRITYMRCAKCLRRWKRIG